MKKTITILLLAVLLIIVPLNHNNRVEAQTDDTCPSIAPYRCNNGSCTNEASLCDQSWGGGLSTGSGGSTNTTTTTAGGSANLFQQRCTGNIRYDREAAIACAQLAERQGRALGYDISCSLEIRTEMIVVNESPTGQTQEAYFDSCMVNGLQTYGIDLVGYTGSGSGYTAYDPLFGTRIIYGSNFNRSPGWEILPCDLVNASAGTTEMLRGVSCSLGASSYFGSSNPSNWKTNTQTAINRSSANIFSSGNISGTTIGGSAGGTNTQTTTSTNLQVFLSQIKSIMDKILADYNKLYRNITITSPTNTTPEIQTPKINTNNPNFSLGNLTTDKTSYCVGETPKYSITGGLSLVGSKILWTSYKNDVVTQEVDADYGFKMTAQGTGSGWSDYGWTWNESHVGNWKKQANIGGNLRSVSFDVKICNTPPTTVSCSPKSIRLFNTYSVIPNLTASGGSGNYSWSAPGSTKTSGAGTQFSTSYAQNGDYQITVSDGTNTDTCTVIISPNLPLAINR